MYIAIEGIDTSGKSTQISKLAKHFEDAIITKEPGATDIGKEIREMVLSARAKSKKAEFLLFLADRAEHYAQVVKTNEDKIVISDRGFLSGIGYALANGDFEFEYLVELNKFALEEVFPDLIVLFITNMETLKERTSKKTLDGIELRGLEYLMSVQNHMEQSLEKLDVDYLLVDANKSIEELHNEIYQKVILLNYEH